MNPFELVKIVAGAVIVAGAYFFGLHDGQNSEQLKMALRTYSYSQGL